MDKRLLLGYTIEHQNLWKQFGESFFGKLFLSKMTMYIEELESYVHDQSEIYAQKKKKKTDMRRLYAFISDWSLS